MTRKGKIMDQQAISQSDLAQIYATPHWKDIFSRHGVDEKYHASWFFNYQTYDKDQETMLNRLKVVAKINTSIALLGQVGNGKTHLATTILKNSIINHKSDLAGKYFTMADLNRKFRNSIKSDEESELKFMESLFNMKCLVIDEIQIKSDSDSEQRMFQEIVDKRYAKEKQTVYAGNVSFNEFKDILGERLVDRMKENGLDVFNFTGESYRSKMARKGFDL